MKKTLTLTLAVTLLIFMAGTPMSGTRLSMALAVDKENPTPKMEEAFSADSFEDTDTSEEGLCSGIGDYQNKNCPSFEPEEVYTPSEPEEVYTPSEPEEVYTPSEPEEPAVLGISTIRPVAPLKPEEDNSQQIMLLIILIILTLALMLISEIRTQKVLQQIQKQLNRRKTAGKHTKH